MFFTLNRQLVFTIISVFVIVLTTAFLPASAEASPALTLGGDLDAGTLEIGGDLSVGVNGAVPMARYSIYLLDEANEAVAKLPDRKANVMGNIWRRLLWQRTGVEGCDEDAKHDPLNYRFMTFEEADLVLDGREFRVVLTDASDPTAVYDVVPVPMEVVTPFIDGHASDGAGCPRFEMEVTEPLHLAVTHQAGVGLNMEVYLVNAQPVWKAGDPVIDVRGVSQLIHVPVGPPSVYLLWMAPLAGEYQVIFRPPGANSNPYDPMVDLLVEMSVKLVGTRADDCGAVCPP